MLWSPAWSRRTAANAARSAVVDAEAVRRLPYRVATFTEETADASRALKQFLFTRVYATPERWPRTGVARSP
jgi:dGTP triphosphohydrolase